MNHPGPMAHEVPTSELMPPVIICDDHHVVRDGLASLLTGAGIDVAGSCASIPELFILIAKYPTSIVIVDLAVDGWEFRELTKRITEISDAIKIVVFSARESRVLMAQCYDLGVLAFLPKTTMQDEVLKAIRYAAKGKTYFNTEVASNLHELHSERKNIEALLTKKEMFIFLSYSRGQSAEKIAEATGVKEKSVSNALSDISSKLECSRSDFVALAREKGYLD
jgi:DNA-binding NarL/FixJ family response regulator